MKTQIQIQSEISNYTLRHSSVFDRTISETRKINRELKFLRMCLNYLAATCKKESYLRKELANLNSRIETIMKPENFDSWRMGNPEKSKNAIFAFSAYKSDMGMTKINKQIKTLEYLLSD